jgi:putative transposase
MHLTLKREATTPAAANALQQQARFDDFLTLFNQERPHQALDMRVPADLSVRSPRPYVGVMPLAYPLHDWTGTVTHCGRICYKSRKVNLSQVFAGQDVGVKQVDDLSGSSPSWTTISATSTTRRAASSRSRTPSARKCYPCLRNKPSPM